MKCTKETDLDGVSCAPPCFYVGTPLGYAVTMRVGNDDALGLECESIEVTCPQGEVQTFGVAKVSPVVLGDVLQRDATVVRGSRVMDSVGFEGVTNRAQVWRRPEFMEEG